MPVIEVFADVGCPFTHVGLRRLVEQRVARGALDVVVHARAWPLELVNGAPLDPHLIAEEVDELRAQVAPDLFTGFVSDRFPDSTLPALELAAAAYARSATQGERVSLALRDVLFEQGRDIASPEVLAEVAHAVGMEPTIDGGHPRVLADWAEGRDRGVIGSPHFFLGEEGFFCPSLAITRIDGRLQITSDPDAFDAFLQRCIAG